MARGSARVARPRLIQALVNSRAALVVAPSGYGKSSLSDEVAGLSGVATVFVEVTASAGRSPALLMSALRRSLRAAGLRSLADALEPHVDAPAAVTALVDLLADREDGVALVFDDTQLLSAAAADWLAEVVRRLPESDRVIVLGQIEPAWRARPSFDVEIGARDLAFTTDEIQDAARQARRPLDRTEAEEVSRATGGWPAAVALAIDTGTTDARSLKQGLGALVESILATALPSARDLARTAAHLPRLSASVLESVAGAGALERLRSSGIPLRERGDGWLVIPDPIRDVLKSAAGAAALPNELARAAATAYLDAGEPDTATDLLLGRGDLDGVAAVLEARPWQELQELDPVELRSLVSVLPRDALDGRPRLLLSVARAASAAGELRWRGELLERAAASSVADPVLQREIDSDRAALASVHGDIDRAKELASGVLAAAEPAETATRARALAALGRARAFERDAGFAADAARHLADAATLARISGERELLAANLLVLGYNVHFAEGDLAAARTRVRESADAAPSTGRSRASTLTFLADVLMYAGELDEADTVLREVADVGHRLRDQGILGYHAWMKAAVSSRRGDAAALETWLAEAERHPGDWLEHPTGIEFLEEAVDWLGRVGDEPQAAAYLARVRERVAADPHEGVDQIELVARAFYNARFGDPADAEADLVAVLETEQLPPREAWRVHLLRALAALRAGDESRAGSLASRAFEHAAALGHPELPQIHEPLAVELLLPLARRTPSAAVRTVEAAELSVAVRLLGGFGVTAGGRPVDPPPGRPQTLVKLLAVRGQPVPIDDAIETLWPELDPETGRARMRNVLSRIRSTSGEVVRRDGEALVLGAGVNVDAAEFERESRAALSAADNEAVLMARRAVSRYGGELLPADRYEDFTVSRRERLALLHLALLDLLAADAEQKSDVDEALRRYAEAIAAAPLDEHRYERAAALALRHGRRQRAREIVDGARRVLDDLGVEPSESLSRIAADLDTHATVR